MTSISPPRVPHFTHFAAVDWSGQAVSHPAGLAVACAEAGTAPPTLLRPAPGWSREGVMRWLLDHAEAGTRLLVGLDLSPAFPFRDLGGFFPGWDASPRSAFDLWRMVDEICADDPHLSASSFVAHPQARRHFRQRGDCGDLFPSGRGRFRLVEAGQEAMGLLPYSCFNLVGAAQVGKSSLTGMRVLHRLRGKVPIWPFDPVPDSGPLIVEIYTTIAARVAGLRKGLSKIREAEALDRALAALGSDSHAPLARYDDHSTDAILAAAWLRRVAGNAALWSPALLTDEIARTEGWTFGVV